jgi:hypothetical protein
MASFGFQSYALGGRLSCVIYVLDATIVALCKTHPGRRRLDPLCSVFTEQLSFAFEPSHWQRHPEGTFASLALRMQRRRAWMRLPHEPVTSCHGQVAGVHDARKLPLAAARHRLSRPYVTVLQQWQQW